MSDAGALARLPDAFLIEKQAPHVRVFPGVVVAAVPDPV